MANDTPSATQTMVTTLGATVAKTLLMTIGSGLAAKGVIAGPGVDTFVAVGMMVVGAGWSFWTSYGRAIAVAQLEIWKAKSQAQVEALHRANVPVPTNAQVAEKIPDPKVTAETVAKATAVVLALLVCFATSSAFAQPEPRAAVRAPLKLPIDPLGLNNRPGTGDPLGDLLGALDAKLLPDLQYALKLAQASGSKVTAPCYEAWINIIQTRQSAVKDDAGNELPMPDPGVVSKFEKLVELRNSLQPDSDFMIKCSPVASMVKKDIVGFIGTVISGGAGLATLVPGL